MRVYSFNYLEWCHLVIRLLLNYAMVKRGVSRRKSFAHWQDSAVLVEPGRRSTVSITARTMAYLSGGGGILAMSHLAGP